MAEDQKDTKETKLTAMCPCCHQAVSIDQFSGITDDDQDGFLMSMLGNVPFERTYRFLKGHILITVRALTPEYTYRHVTLSGALVRNTEKLPGGYGQAVILAAMLEQLLMVKSISISTATSDTHVDIEVPEDLLNEIEYYKSVDPVEDDKFLKRMVDRVSKALTKDLSIPMNLISEATTRHKLLVDKLITSCYDEGFYQGVEQQ